MAVRKTIHIGDKIVFNKIHRNYNDDEALTPAMGIGQVTNIFPDRKNPYLVATNGWVRKKDITEVIPLRQLGDKITYNSYSINPSTVAKTILDEPITGEITRVEMFALNQYQIDNKKVWIREANIIK